MNVKQGDLAIVTNARLPENIGKVVSVVKFLVERDVWVVDFARPTRLVDSVGQVFQCNLGHVRDAWLRPISGIPDADNMDKSISHDAGIAVPA